MKNMQNTKFKYAKIDLKLQKQHMHILLLLL